MTISARKERGFSIIENLVAIALLGIASVSTVPVIAASFAATSSARSHSAVLSEIEGIVSDYRTMPYPELLQKIDSDLPQIADGESGTETIDVQAGRATVEVTVTAIKTQPLGLPEGVRLRMRVEQRQGHLNPREYEFETIITQVS